MVRTLHFHCRGMASLPGWGTNVLRAEAWPKKNKNKTTHCPIKHTAEGKREEGKKKEGSLLNKLSSQQRKQAMSVLDH